MNHKYVMKVICLILCCVLLSGCMRGPVDVLKDAASDRAPDSAPIFASKSDSSSVPEKEDSAATIYSDKDRGISFILPAGWSTEELDDENNSLLIIADSADAPAMVYVGRDLWQEGFGADSGVPRSFLNNDLLADDAFAEEAGIHSSSIERIVLNGYEFYRSEVDDFAEGIEKAVAWYRLDQGWFDTFVFAADAKNSYFSQFEALITSATYDRAYEEEVPEYIPEENTYSGYLSAEWSDTAFKRNGCTSYPLVLDTPLERCKGFTVDYQATVVEGRMKDDSKFQIFYRLSNGTWEKGKTFYLDDGFASVEQTISKPVTVTEVCVLCLNAGNFSWNCSMGVKDPRY